MGLGDRLRGITKKAEETAAEHKDEIRQAFQKAEAAADQRTGGKYHEQIQTAGAKADAFLEGLKEAPKPQSPGSPAEESAEGDSTSRAGSS
jgi:hypothetical protein